MSIFFINTTGVAKETKDEKKNTNEQDKTISDFRTFERTSNTKNKRMLNDRGAPKT